MKSTSYWIIPLLLLPIWTNSAFAVDPARSLDQNVVRTWGVDQGLPQGTVYALTQTADGYSLAPGEDESPKLNGRPIPTEGIALKNGDVIEVAGTRLQFYFR